MKNGFLFSTARATALMSIAGGPVVVIVDTQTARAAPPGRRPEAVVEPGPDLHEIRFRGFLDEFWQGAWDTDFVVHQSGMTLEQTDGGGPRVVLAYDGEETVGTGRYHERARFPVTVPGIPPDDPHAEASFSFEHFATAGILRGSTGYEKPIYGLAQRVVFAPDGADPIVVEGLTPLGVTDTADGAVAAARETLGLLAARVWGGPVDGPHLEPPETACLCAEIYFNELDACLADSIACQATCAAVAIAGIVACLALGPLTGPCIVAILTAEALCMAGCLARQKACNLRAETEWLRCWLDCFESGP
jgi:hypothetical protein